MAISPFDLLPNETLANIFVNVGQPQTTMLVSKRWLAISQIFFENVLNEYMREAGVNPHLKPFVDRALEQIPEGSVTIDHESYDFLALKRIQEIYRLVSEAHISLFGQTPFASPSIPGNILHNIGVERIKQEVHRIELNKADNLLTLCWMMSNTFQPAALFWTNTLQLDEPRDPWCYMSGMNLTEGEIFAVADKIRVWTAENRDLLSSGVSMAIGLNSWVQENEWGRTPLPTKRLLTLPSEIECLRNLEIVVLDDEGLRQWPPVLSTFSNLEHLDLGYNQLYSLPEEIENLVRLKILSLDHNNLISIPASIGNLTLLEELYLNNNQLTAVPPEILNLQNLQILDLENNLISRLPHLGYIESLTTARIDNNPIEIGCLDIHPRVRPQDMVISIYMIDGIVNVSNSFETSPFILQILIRPLVFSAFLITTSFALVESLGFFLFETVE